VIEIFEEFGNLNLQPIAITSDISWLHENVGIDN